jgi:hypothetical protein
MFGMVVAMIGLISPVSAWWDTDWDKKVPITVNVSSGETRAEYQVGVNVTYDSDMESDFGDIRFLNGSENALLSYFMEDKLDGSWAYFIVEVDQPISSTDYDIYMYYDNAVASTLSNGEATFPFFDNFSVGSLNTSKWKVFERDSMYCDYFLADEKINMKCWRQGSGAWQKTILTALYNGYNITSEAQILNHTNGCDSTSCDVKTGIDVGRNYTDGNNGAVMFNGTTIWLKNYDRSPQDNHWTYDGADNSDTNVSYNATNGTVISARVMVDLNADLDFNHTTESTHTTGTPYEGWFNASLHALTGRGTGWLDTNHSTWFDWFRIRLSHDSEPEYYTGAEESAPASPTNCWIESAGMLIVPPGCVFYTLITEWVIGS